MTISGRVLLLPTEREPAGGYTGSTLLPPSSQCLLTSNHCGCRGKKIGNFHNSSLFCMCFFKHSIIIIMINIVYKKYTSTQQHLFPPPWPYNKNRTFSPFTMKLFELSAAPFPDDPFSWTYNVSAPIHQN